MMFERTIRRHAALATLAVLMGAGAAFAQSPTLAVATLVATPGNAVTATVTGVAGQFYAVLGSAVGSGLAYGGVDLAVGSDVVLLATGILNGAGTATVSVTPPFRGTTIDRYYLQAATSSVATFVPLAVSTSVVIRNADVVPLPVSAIVNPNGTLQFGSQGVTTSRTGPGAYRINYPGLVAAPFVPLVMPIAARILSHDYSATGIDLTLDTDAFFHVMVFHVRP